MPSGSRQIQWRHSRNDAVRFAPFQHFMHFPAVRPAQARDPANSESKEFLGGFDVCDDLHRMSAPYQGPADLENCQPRLQAEILRRKFVNAKDNLHLVGT